MATRDLHLGTLEEGVDGLATSGLELLLAQIGLGGIVADHGLAAANQGGCVEDLVGVVHDRADALLRGSRTELCEHLGQHRAMLPDDARVLLAVLLVAVLEHVGRLHAEALLQLVYVLDVGLGHDGRRHPRLDSGRADLDCDLAARGQRRLPVGEGGEELLVVARAAAQHDLLELQDAVLDDHGRAAVVVVLLPAEDRVHGVHGLRRSDSGRSSCIRPNLLALSRAEDLPIVEAHDVTACHGLARIAAGCDLVLREDNHLLEGLAEADRQDSARCVGHCRRGLGTCSKVAMGFNFLPLLH